MCFMQKIFLGKKIALAQLRTRLNKGAEAEVTVSSTFQEKMAERRWPERWRHGECRPCGVYHRKEEAPGAAAHRYSRGLWVWAGQGGPLLAGSKLWMEFLGKGRLCGILGFSLSVDRRQGEQNCRCGGASQHPGTGKVGLQKSQCVLCGMREAKQKVGGTAQVPFPSSWRAKGPQPFLPLCFWGTACPLPKITPGHRWSNQWPWYSVSIKFSPDNLCLFLFFCPSHWLDLWPWIDHWTSQFLFSYFKSAIMKLSPPLEVLGTRNKILSPQPLMSSVPGPSVAQCLVCVNVLTALDRF